jgi:hypothetical protein
MFIIVRCQTLCTCINFHGTHSTIVHRQKRYVLIDLDENKCMRSIRVHNISFVDSSKISFDIHRYFPHHSCLIVTPFIWCVTRWVIYWQFCFICGMTNAIEQVLMLHNVTQLSLINGMFIAQFSEHINTLQFNCLCLLVKIFVMINDLCTMECSFVHVALFIHRVSMLFVFQCHFFHMNLYFVLTRKNQRKETCKFTSACHSE